MLNARAPTTTRRQVVISLAGASLGAAGLFLPRTAPAQPSDAPPLPIARFDAGQRGGPPAGSLWKTGTAGYDFGSLRLDSADGKRGYILWLAVPVATPPRGGHPLVVMLDGNSIVDKLGAAQLQRVASHGDAPVIAALGPDYDARFDNGARVLDYTPPVRSNGPTWEDDSTRLYLGGGADVFYELIRKQAIAAVTRHAGIDPRRMTLWGHSYGGLFALHVLFRHPEVFTRYAPAEASLRWHDGFILKEARTAARLPPGRKTSLLFMQGRSAISAPPLRAGADAAEIERRRKLDLAVPPASGRQLVRMLDQRDGLQAIFAGFPELEHFPMLDATIEPALAFAAAPA